MKKLLLLFTFFFTVAVSDAASQGCYCPDEPYKNLYTLSFSNDSLKLCGIEYDKYKRDMIIGGFVLSQCSVDTLLINAMHDEAASFLFQKTKTGFTLILLDLSYENGKFQYPEQFEKITVAITNNKPVFTNVDIEAAPVVIYLEKNFKKLSELY